MRRASFTTYSLAAVTVIAFQWTGDAGQLAAQVLDQYHELTRYESAAGVGYNIYQKVAQTVRVGLTGQLLRLDFWANRVIETQGDLRIDFQLLPTDQAPVDPSLASAGHIIIPHDQLAILIPPTLPTDVSPFLYSVDLTPLNLNFQAGDNFAFIFSNTDPSGGTIGTAFGVMGDHSFSPGPYATGTAYLRNNNQNGGQFFAWTDGDPVNPGPQWVDLGFRTYMSVPEPASIVLVAALFVALPTRRCKSVPHNRV